MKTAATFVKLCSSIALLSAILSCSSISTALDPVERRLEVNGEFEREFHSTLYFPKGESLHYPGYVVAIEKSPQSTIGGPSTDPGGTRSFLNTRSYYVQAEPGTGNFKGTARIIRDFEVNDRKVLFVSHIIRYSTIQSSSGPSPYQMIDQCFVYNAYRANGVLDKENDMTKITAWHDCPAQSFQIPGNIGDIYMDGLKALKKLEDNLINDVAKGGYTHIVVIVMGWNTSQDEAIRNFNDIVGNVVEAAYADTTDANNSEAKHNAITAQGVSPEPFRPLVVGVTWPSFWTNTFINWFSYGDSANDADQLGLTWVNVLINRTLPAVIDKVNTEKHKSTAGLKIVLIGHSFGARAATRALFSRPVLEYGDISKDPPRSGVDLAIGLQGAVSINRFVPEDSDEGAPYRDFKTLGKTKIVLTAAQNDQATGAPFWYAPSGSFKAYNKACEGANKAYESVFDCWRAMDTSSAGGTFKVCRVGTDECLEPSSNAAQTNPQILYIDASNGITKFNSPGSGGGAHSDIYRLPMGRLIWRLIQNYAP
jgi:hypothetical protein